MAALLEVGDGIFGEVKSKAPTCQCLATSSPLVLPPLYTVLVCLNAYKLHCNFQYLQTNKMNLKCDHENIVLKESNAMKMEKCHNK